MTSPVDVVIEPRPRDLGGFSVHRLLPAIGHRMVGPFVFFDEMDGDLPPGHGLDVRPHPHIGLATVTYLLAGEIVHRDSLGSLQPIHPGAINWMTAGRGIVHSERSGPEARAHGGPVRGVQLWVALPVSDEETAPAFHHHPADTLPGTRDRGAAVRVLAGRAYGLEAPVQVFSPLCYVDATLDAGAALPLPDDHEERAVFVLSGEVEADGAPLPRGHLVVYRPGAAVTVRATAPSRLLILGGAPVGPRHIWWNFVSSSRERIEEAKAAWAERRFPPVLGDAVELTPLPES